MHAFKGLAAAALAVATLSAPALAQTTQFMVAGAPVTVGAMPANSGAGYSIYHYRSLGVPHAVTVTCSCDQGSKIKTASCDKVNYDCACPSANVTCD